MKGLALSKAYFEEYGHTLITSLEEAYPALRGQFAAGLVGQGSECLGFDDDLSVDHDFGPSFCLWLPKRLYEPYGKLCQQAYQQLPGEFRGHPARKVMLHGHGRVGVLCTEDFYFGLTGAQQIPKTNLDWINLSETSLSQAVNGEVFRDDPGEFTAFRNSLLAFYPDDILYKKIAARAAAMAQSGQYNYSRLCKRKEWTGAYLALAEFMKNTCSVVHLLNRRYVPFYKWMHRSLQDMPILPEIYGLMEQLAEGKDMKAAWENVSEADFLYGFLNTRDQNAVLIETICQLVIRELRKQGISDEEDMYLEPHAMSVMKKIKDPMIRSLPLLYG